jgi:hypothetical protein
MKTASAVKAWRRREAMRPEPVTKRAVVGGPWEGLTVVVRTNMERSLDLVINGRRGRFERLGGSLKWVEAA